MPRSELDALTDHAKRYGAGGLVWAFVQDDGSWRSPTAKFLSDGERAAVTRRLHGAPGDLLLIVADTPAVAATALGELRLELARRFALVPPGRHELLWVVDFPMFEFNEAEGRWDALHHPFTAPVGDFADPGALRSRGYDVVLDGSEIGGGSIRINRPEVQRQVFDALGISEREAGERFGFLLDALRYGAPPHGGHRARDRPRGGADRRARLDPRRDRVPQDGQRRGPAHGRAGAGGQRSARRARPAAHRATPGRLTSSSFVSGLDHRSSWMPARGGQALREIGRSAKGPAP